MIVGIIAEYNPFHNGHSYHIQKSKEISKSELCVVVMSGNFVQRGEPAIINKFIRTKLALMNGADVVIELPVYFSTSSADLFAFGAIDLLNKTGIIDNICFGSECGKLSEMENISEILLDEPIELKNEIKNLLKQGISYPKARFKALSNLTNFDISFLESPNNILAIEYIKSLKKIKSDIKPYIILRKGAGFHSKEIKGNIASASGIREAINNIENNLDKIKKCIPKNIYDIFIKEIKKAIPKIDDYSEILHYILRTKSLNELSNIFDVTEGLENRIIKNSDKKYISEIINSVKTKRYTYTKIQRAILHMILGITKQKMDFIVKNGLNQYIRILGFKKESEYILKLIKKNSNIPIITNIKKSEKYLNDSATMMLKDELLSTDLYYISSTLERNKDITEPIIVL